MSPALRHRRHVLSSDQASNSCGGAYEGLGTASSAFGIKWSSARVPRFITDFVPDCHICTVIHGSRCLVIQTRAPRSCDILHLQFALSRAFVSSVSRNPRWLENCEQQPAAFLPGRDTPDLGQLLPTPVISEYHAHSGLLALSPLAADLHATQVPPDILPPVSAS
jgi:hypothetical protein